MAGSQSAALGIAVIAVSMIVGVLVMMASTIGIGLGQPGGGGVGSGNNKAVIICDLQVVVSGTVNDYNVAPTVTGWDISSPQSINCREKTLGDSLNDIFAFALFGTGYTDITAKAFDEKGNKIRDGSGFTVITEHLVTSKNFSQKVTIERLEKGKTYDIRAFTSWGGDIPQHNKLVTVP